MWRIEQHGRIEGLLISLAGRRSLPPEEKDENGTS